MLRDFLEIQMRAALGANWIDQLVIYADDCVRRDKVAPPNKKNRGIAQIAKFSRKMKGQSRSDTRKNYIDVSGSNAFLLHEALYLSAVPQYNFPANAANDILRKIAAQGSQNKVPTKAPTNAQAANDEIRAAIRKDVLNLRYCSVWPNDKDVQEFYDTFQALVEARNLYMHADREILDMDELSAEDRLDIQWHMAKFATDMRRTLNYLNDPNRWKAAERQEYIARYHSVVDKLIDAVGNVGSETGAAMEQTTLHADANELPSYAGKILRMLQKEDLRDAAVENLRQDHRDMRYYPCSDIVSAFCHKNGWTESANAADLGKIPERERDDWRRRASESANQGNEALAAVYFIGYAMTHPQDKACITGYTMAGFLAVRLRNLPIARACYHLAANAQNAPSEEARQKAQEMDYKLQHMSEEQFLQAVEQLTGAGAE